MKIIYLCVHISLVLQKANTCSPKNLEECCVYYLPEERSEAKLLLSSRKHVL